MFGIGNSAARTGVPRPSAPNFRAITRPRHWARAQSENPLTRFVPFSSLVSPVDVITRGGDYLRVWRLDGVAFECADEHTIAERHGAKCSLLRNLAGGQFAVWEHRLHRAIEDDMAVPTEPGFARDLGQAYGSLLHKRRMMSNELYMTLVYRPTVSAVGRAFQSTRRTRQDIAKAQEDAIRVMEEKAALVQRVLRGFDPVLLGTERRNGPTTPRLPSSSATSPTVARNRYRRRPGLCTARCRRHACPSAATSSNCDKVTPGATRHSWTSRSTPTPCSPAY